MFSPVNYGGARAKERSKRIPENVILIIGTEASLMGKSSVTSFFDARMFTSVLKK